MGGKQLAYLMKKTKMPVGKVRYTKVQYKILEIHLPMRTKLLEGSVSESCAPYLVLGFFDELY